MLFFPQYNLHCSEESVEVPKSACAGVSENTLDPERRYSDLGHIHLAEPQIPRL